MRRATVTVLSLLAATWCARAEAQVAIRDIRLTLDPVTYSGPCPVRLRAHVVFVSNFPARVDQDDWGWNFTRTAPHSWDVDGGHLRTSGLETAVDTTLTLPRAGDTGGLLHEGSVHVTMALNPTISNTVRYSVRCSPAVTLDPNLVKPIQPGPTIALQKVPTLPPPSGGGPGPIVHLPDLVPEILDPFAFRVAVRNVGDAAAGPSAVLLKCRATSGASARKRRARPTPRSPRSSTRPSAASSSPCRGFPRAARSSSRCPRTVRSRGPRAPTSSRRSPTSATPSRSETTATTRRRARSRADDDPLGKDKGPDLSVRALQISRQRPTLPHSFPCSTIGSEGLNGRVRNGNGWGPLDKATGNSISFPYRTERCKLRMSSYVRASRILWPSRTDD